MLEYAVPLKLQQVTLGEKLPHGTLEMPLFSLFLKAMYNSNPNCLESSRERPCVGLTSSGRRKIWFSKFLMQPWLDEEPFFLISVTVTY